MSTINKNNIDIPNQVYINEYNNKNSIFITKHVYTIITISQVLKTKICSRLHPLCSLSQSLPEIHSSHLKNLEIPLIHATKWISQVFFCAD